MSASIDPDVTDKTENDEFCQSAGYPKKIHVEEHEPVHHEELAHGLFEDPDRLQEGDLLALGDDDDDASPFCGELCHGVFDDPDLLQDGDFFDLHYDDDYDSADSPFL